MVSRQDCWKRTGGQTIFNLAQIEGITLGAGEEVSHGLYKLSFVLDVGLEFIFCKYVHVCKGSCELGFLMFHNWKFHKNPRKVSEYIIFLKKFSSILFV